MQSDNRFPTELPLAICRQVDLRPLSATSTEPYWDDAEVLPFREAIRGGSPEQGTNVRAVWSHDALRVLFQVSDHDVWATLTERNAPLYTEEVVEIFIDPIGDLESYFEIEVNPLNAVLDLVCRRNRSGYLKDFSWQCDDLETLVKSTSDGWNCEMHVPFASLTSVIPQIGSEWRVNFLRIDRPKSRERELSAWSPTMVGTFHVPSRFGRLRFAE